MDSFFSRSVFLSLMMVAHVASAQTWVDQNTNTTSTIFPIKAVDENTVWAGSTDNIFLKTTDGGATWTTGVVPGSESLDILSIAAIDSEIAYFTATSFTGTDTRIYKTSDGGTSWELQYQNTAAGAFINSIAFWDEMHGIAVSDPVGGNFLVLTTRDGGANWIRTPVENIPPPLPGEYAGFGDGGGTPLAVQDSSYAWFGTNYAIVQNNDPVRVFKTKDKGLNWTVSNTPIPTDGRFYGISTLAFKDSLNGFAGGGGFGLPPTGNTLARTTDGGQTWSLVSSFLQTISSISTLIFVPQTDFQFLVASTAEGVIFSKDGGMTWLNLSTDNFIGVSFAGPTAGWAGGEEGRIAKFSGDLTTVVNVEQISEIPQDFELLQNFPNPFKTSTTIMLTLDHRVPVKLAVFDLLGNEVAVLLKTELGPGIHEVKFDAGDLPSGIYFYRVQAGRVVSTKKLTVIR